MPWLIELKHKGRYPCKMYLKKSWSGWTSSLKDAEQCDSQQGAARAVNRSGCGMDEDTEIVYLAEVTDWRAIVDAILAVESLRPLLIGIHPDLDEHLNARLKGNK